jgi:hypothetical protein
MFKILLIKSNILNIKLDEEGGGSQNERGDGNDNKGNNCGKGCGRNGCSDDDGAFRSFTGVMFKILLIKSNILNIKLDEEGGVSQNERGDGNDNKGNNGDDEW